MIKTSHPCVYTIIYNDEHTCHLSSCVSTKWFALLIPTSHCISLTEAAGASFTSIIHTDTYPEIDPLKAKHVGHAVFITGGSRGIGLATAKSFARAGASFIAIGDLDQFDAGLEADLINVAKSAAQAPPKILLLKVDVRDHDSLFAAAQSVEQSFGRLDILFNNAGFMTPAKPIEEADISSYWNTFEVNVKGVFLTTKAFLPLLYKSDGLKTILNMNSVAAHNLRPQASAYGTSKSTILRFTEFLMVEGAPKGLLAYCIHPGAVMTVLAEAMPKETHAGMPSPLKIILGASADMVQTVLIDRPELCANTAVYLTQERRLWLAGRYISSTWDIPEFLSREKEIVEGDKLKVRLVL